ncbi:MAG TPA: hypothetical protein VG267_05555 [Terracidiphilus sp.]|nr:hypothetical protein [Terracidiphilus sp.]
MSHFRGSLQGYVPAIHSLGYLLINHPEFAASPGESSTLLQESSSAGCWQSNATLGILARDRDPALAFYYFHLSVLQAGEPAQRLLANDLAALARKLTPEEQSARAAQADQWFQQHPLPLLFVFREKERNERFPMTAVADYSDAPHLGR